MADDAAVLEAAVDTALDTTSTDTSTSVDDTAAHGTSEVIDDADSPQPGEVENLRGAELFRAVKEKFRKGEPLTPQEFRSMRAAIHIAGKADELTGGDLERFETERGIVSKLADEGDDGLTPEQILENTLDERNFWRGFDDKFQTGDASVIPQLFEANPASAAKLIVAGMDHLSQADNDVFSNYVARSAISYLSDQKIPLQFAILDTFLPEKSDNPATQRVIDAINSIRNAFQGLEGIANKKVEVKAGIQNQNQGNGKQTDDQSLTEREMRVTVKEWNAGARTANDTLSNDEMSRAASARKMQLTDAERSEIRAAVTDEFNARLAAKPEYGKAMQGFIKAGNQRAYADRAASEGKKLLPAIVQRHTNAVLDKRAQQKAQPAVKQTTGQQKSQTAQTGNLIQHLPKHPKLLGKRIDLGRTTFAMQQKNQGYLVGEKNLYQWPEFKA